MSLNFVVRSVASRRLLGLLALALSCASGLGQDSAPDHQVRRVGDNALVRSLDRVDRQAALGPAQTDPQTIYEELAEDFALIDRLSGLVKRVAAVAKPSVVHVEARKIERSRGHSEAFDEAGAGVAVLIAGERWILTNRHVIAGAKPSEVVIRSADGQKVRARQVFADASTDVAVMRLDTELPTARIGSAETVEIGDFVIAIGSPFGLSHSVTFGILSARGRRDLTLGHERIELQDFYQTDAAINPGNSGGPLLNLRGEVVAINTAIASNGGGSEGIGFAIPIKMAMHVAEELVRHGKLRRGYLGVTLDPEFAAADALRVTGAAFGALVKEVRPGSPAERARLRRGDVIVEFDGTRIENDDHLVTRVGLTEIGREVPLVIFRDGHLYRASLAVESAR